MRHEQPESATLVAADARFRADVLRTESTQLHTGQVTADEVVKGLAGAVIVADALDMAKKGLFYGKDVDAELGGREIERRFAELDALVAKGGDFTRVDPRVLHAIVGVVTEAGELAKAALLALTGEAPLDLVNLKEESGDLEWYQELLGDAAGFTTLAARAAMLAKLRKRYGEVFSSEAALNRDLDAERAVLEGAAA